MAHPSDFKTQNWISKKDELLRLANYKCAEGCDEEANEVHVCYYLRGREIWELPADAYKCYCQYHRGARRDIEDAIRFKLSVFSINDLDALHQALEELAKLRISRAQIIQQIYVEAKNKHSHQDDLIEYPGDDENEEEF